MATYGLKYAEKVGSLSALAITSETNVMDIENEPKNLLVFCLQVTYLMLVLVA